MTRISGYGLLCVVLALFCAGGGRAATLLTDTFEGAAVGALPLPWKMAVTNPLAQARVASGYAGNTTKLIWFSDTNSDTSNNTLYATYSPVTQGLCTFQFDVCLSSIHAGFGLRITNGLTPTSGGNWAAAIKFEGDVPYAPGGGAGSLSYQEYTSGSNAYTPTNPAATYQADTWYTARIQANLDTRIYHLYFGPRGGVSSRVTPSTGVAFIKTTTGGQTGTAGGVSVFSSQRAEPEGSIYIDNVIVTGGVETPGTIADAKQLPLGTYVAMSNKVVSVGTDQTNRPFFYVQDNTAGIRVRTTSTVRQGDRVDLRGTIQRTDDSGSATERTGEREINATTLTVTYGPFAMPKPIGMTNRSVGGAPLGPIDTDGCPCQPGVFAGSDGTGSVYDQISESGPSSIGRLCRVWGRVAYADDTNRFIYITDGSNVSDGSRLADNSTLSPSGIRVLVAPGTPLAVIAGKYVVVTGVVGAVAAREAGWPDGEHLRSIRVVRAACEPFLDLNLNGYWNPGEAFVDTNANGACDGVSVYDAVPGPAFVTGFDRYGTAITRGAPFVPKGIYVYSPETPTLDEMVRQGFNTIVCFDTNPGVLPALNERNLKILPCLRTEDARTAWLAAKDDPAILAWYMYDEPEGYGTTPQIVSGTYSWLKQQDPTHPGGNSHFLYNALSDYAGCEDFLISDRYPVGNSDMITLAVHLAYARAAHGPNFPLWQFVQCFYEQPNFALPTPDQVRAMAYLALMFEAKGLLYFSYQRPSLPDWPADWAEVKKLNAEVDLFRAFLTMPRVPIDATTSTESVRIGGFRVGGSALIITVNVTGSPQTATFSLPGVGESTLTLPLEGGTSQPLANRSMTLTYAPFQTRVFLLGSIPATP